MDGILEEVLEEVEVNEVELVTARSLHAMVGKRRHVEHL